MARGGAFKEVGEEKRRGWLARGNNVIRMGPERKGEGRESDIGIEWAER